MIKGRPDIAPCGHRGEVVIGTFVRCIEGCDDDAAPAYVEPEDTLKIKVSAMCPYCGASSVQRFVHPFMSSDTMHCLDCGKIWRDP